MSKQQPVSEEFDARLIHFGESPVLEEWKTRLCQRLSGRADVFSLHELNVRLAKGVEHTIRLPDLQPFHEHSRRIAPADIDDVQQAVSKSLKVHMCPQ